MYYFNFLKFKYGLIPEDIFTFVQLSTKEMAIKFGAYVCVSGGLAWLVYYNWPIKMSSSHATTLTCQRCKQMLPTLVDFPFKVWFDPTWSNFIQLDLIWSNLIWFDPNNQSDPTWSDLNQFQPIWSDLIQIIPIGFKSDTKNSNNMTNF